MSDALILVPLGAETLALSPDQFREALERGRALMSPIAPTAPSTGSTCIVDADGAAAATGVPATWFLEAARRGDIPSLQLGKYRRFRLDEILRCVEVRPNGGAHPSTHRRTR